MNEQPGEVVGAGDAGAAAERISGRGAPARSLAERIEGGATSASRAVGARLVSVSTRVRPRAGAVADPLAEAGAYLRDSDARQIGADITDIIRRHPFPSLAVGVAVGFVIGRLLAR